MTSVVVKTEVEVDLSNFHTKDLIDEVERRGHAVDAECAADLDTNDLLKELSLRAYSINFHSLPLKTLLEGLKQYHCPSSLMNQLLDWEREPVPTLKKLEDWLSACGKNGHS
jgi:hypothetical protein